MKTYVNVSGVTSVNLATFAAMFWYGDRLWGYSATYLHSPISLHGVAIN